MIIDVAGYPGAAQHAASHRTLVNQAVALANSFHVGSVAIGEVFKFLAHDVVARHLLGEDREFFAYLQIEPENLPTIGAPLS